jgi:hypothetical protein
MLRVMKVIDAAFESEARRQSIAVEILRLSKIHQTGDQLLKVKRKNEES